MDDEIPIIAWHGKPPSVWLCAELYDMVHSDDANVTSMVHNVLADIGIRLSPSREDNFEIFDTSKYCLFKLQCGDIFEVASHLTGGAARKRQMRWFNAITKGF